MFSLIVFNALGNGCEELILFITNTLHTFIIYFSEIIL